MKTIKYKGFDIEISEDGKYVSVNGKIKHPYIIKPKRSRKGFYQICLGRGIKEYIHKLVAIAYLPNYDYKKIVAHKNSNTLYNHWKNLEHASYSKISSRAIKNLNIPRQTAHFIKNDIDFKNVVVRLKSGDTLKNIATDYHTSDMSIYRFKIRNKKIIKCQK